jgi:ABC-type transporter Mla subunit MlaD
VQGLDIGSPVKYRGVKIGEIKDISVVCSNYPLKDLSMDEIYTYGLYVQVTASLSDSFIAILQGDDIQKELDKLIKEKGLRLRMNYLGVTGLAYLELDFLDPKANPPLPIKWDPNNYYIPSMRNTIQVITESLNDISKAFQSDFIPLIENLNQASLELPEVTQNLKETLASLRDTFEKVSASADQFPQLASKLDETLFHVNEIFKNEAYDVQEIIQNIRALTADLKVTAENLKQYPAQVIFGDAPQKVKE